MTIRIQKREGEEMFNRHDLSRNEYMLDGCFCKNGYDWWWHSFTARHEKTGEEKAFFVEYFLCNPALGGDKAVLGQLPENKVAGKKPSYLMVKAGSWGKNPKQLHRFFAWDEVKLHKRKPFSVKAKDCFASDTELTGSVGVSEVEAKEHPEYMCDAGYMTWNLKLDKKVAFNVGYGAGRLFRKIKAFEMYWHAEGMKTLYSGTVEIDGERYIVTPETSFGYADKNWGSNFTSPWVWLSSNCMRSKVTGKVLKNSVFNIGGGCPKIYFFPLNRKLLGAFWYEGNEYEYNFSKFWTLPRTQFSFQETATEVRWKVRQENRTSVMKTEVRCLKSDLLLINYEAPDGSKRHKKLWNGGTGIGNIKLYKKTRDGLMLIDDIVATHVGCEYGEYES